MRGAETLFINKSDSFCGECGLPANPRELTHEKAWWDGAKGCGIRWTKVSSEYIGLSGLKERVQQMRPDLEWVGD